MNKSTIFVFLFFLCFGVLAQSVENKRTKQQYTTIQRAVNDAVAHDTLFLNSNIYRENTIVIDKPLSLIGKGKAVLDGEYSREIMQITSDSVTVKNLHFKDVGESFTKDFAAIRVIKSKHFNISDNEMTNVFYGIFCEKSSEGHISNNRISGNAQLEYKSGNGIHLWNCQNVIIKANHLTKLRDGIYFEFVNHTLIEGNSSHDNIRYGLHFMFSNNDVYQNNVFSKNGAGVAVMFSKYIEMYNNTFSDNWGASSYGLLLKEIYNATIKGNNFYRNTTGIHCEGSNRINYTNNTFSDNGWAVRIKGGCFENHFSYNNFINNTFNLSYNGSLNDNTFNKNYWNDNVAFDLNRDGFADVPYRPVKLFSYINEKSPESIVLLRSLFVDIINFSEKTLPVFTPTNLLDHQPLMKKVNP